MMRTSAHSKFLVSPSAPPSIRQTGFTLIEIMVVLVIVGIIVSLAALSLNSNPATMLDREGRRLQAVLNQASEEAELQGIELALALSRDPDTHQSQYQLLILDKQDQQWTLPEEDDPNAKLWAVHTLDSNVILDLSIEGQQLTRQQMAQISRVQSLAVEADLRPSIMMLSSGEITPFTLRLSLLNSDYRIQLSSDGANGVMLQ